jgi:hypothetical protein
MQLCFENSELLKQHGAIVIQLLEDIQELSDAMAATDEVAFADGFAAQMLHVW